MPRSQARRMQSGTHFRQFQLNRLQLANRLAKGLSLLGVNNSTLEGSLCNSEGLCSNADPSGVES